MDSRTNIDTSVGLNARLLEEYQTDQNRKTSKNFHSNRSAELCSLEILFFVHCLVFKYQYSIRKIIPQERQKISLAIPFLLPSKSLERS